MGDSDPATGDGGGSTRERLRAPLAHVGWQAYEALLYLIRATIIIALHLGLMIVVSLSGIGMERLVIGMVVRAEEESRLAAVMGTATDAAVAFTAFFIAVLGLLNVGTRAWRDFKDRA